MGRIEGSHIHSNNLKYENIHLRGMCQVKHTYPIGGFSFHSWRRGWNESSSYTVGMIISKLHICHNVTIIVSQCDNFVMACKGRAMFVIAVSC